MAPIHMITRIPTSHAFGVHYDVMIYTQLPNPSVNRTAEQWRFARCLVASYLSRWARWWGFRRQYVFFLGGGALCIQRLGASGLEGRLS